MKKIDKLVEEAQKTLDVNTKPYMSDSQAGSLSPFQLKLLIDAKDKYIKDLERTLNNPDKLKKIIKDRTKLAKVSKELKETKKKFVENLPEHKAIPNKADLADTYSINKTIINKYLNIDKLEFLGSGVSTLIFKHPSKKDMVLGVTIDPYKMKWLNADKEAFKFKMLHQFDYDRGNKAYIFEMKKFDKFFDTRKMSKGNMNIVFSDVIYPFLKLQNRKGFDGVTIKDLDWIMEPITDKHLLSILKKLKSTFNSNEILDLHGGQWADDEKGNIVLFDPVIDDRIFNRTSPAGSLDLSMQVENFIDKLFKADKDKEKILKKILRK